MDEKKLGLGNVVSISVGLVVATSCLVSLGSGAGTLGVTFILAMAIAMLLNIIGVFEAEEMNSNSDGDGRYAEWQLINALNEYGLYREGLRSDQIQEILTKTFSKYVNVQVANKEDHNLIELIQDRIDP